MGGNYGCCFYCRPANMYLSVKRLTPVPLALGLGSCAAVGRFAWQRSECGLVQPDFVNHAAGTRKTPVFNDRAATSIALRHAQPVGKEIK